MAYKMVFSDMDGTLLCNGRTISAKNQEAIQKAMDKGVDFVICTGRGIFGVKEHLKKLNVIGKSGYVICQNGAMVYDLEQMQVLWKKGFSPSLIKPIADYARALGGIELFYYDDATFLCERITEEVKEYCQVMQTTPQIIADPILYKGELTKCLFSGEREKLEEVRKFAVRLLGEQLNLFYSAQTYLEFVCRGVDKGTAMEEIAKVCGVAMEETIAIGDSENDLSMIQKAGLGVAMCNGEAEIKVAAKYITKRNAQQHGVAEVIETFIL